MLISILTPRICGEIMLEKVARAHKLKLSGIRLVLMDRECVTFHYAIEYVISSFYSVIGNVKNARLTASKSENGPILVKTMLDSTIRGSAETKSSYKWRRDLEVIY